MSDAPVSSPLSADPPGVPGEKAEGAVKAGTRVDEAHAAGQKPARGQRSAAKAPLVSAARAVAESQAPSPSSPRAVQPAWTDGEDWLGLHATELIDQLQQLAESLDARESRLHAQIALHERREREFRLWSQSRRTEIEEQLAEAERQRAELKAAARRLALQEESSGARQPEPSRLENGQFDS